MANDPHRTDPHHTGRIEQVVSAYREPDPRGTVKPSPSFFDLDEDARIEAFDATVLARTLEAALDPDGASTTVRAVLARIAATRPREEGE